MSECTQSRLLNAYHDGELSPADREQFERHLGQCPACQAELVGVRKLSSLLAGEPNPVMPPHVAKRMHSAVDSFFASKVLHFAEVVSAIAAAILITCMLGLFGRTAPQQVAPPTAVQASVLDVSILQPPTEPISTSSPSYEEEICQLMVQDLSGDQGQ